MFKVGDVVYINPNSAMDWIDGRISLLQYNDPYTIQKILPEIERDSSWQRRGELYFLLKEIHFWVNEKCLISEESWTKKTPVERKIAHLYKLFTERKENVESA